MVSLRESSARIRQVGRTRVSRLVWVASLVTLVSTLMLLALADHDAASRAAGSRSWWLRHARVTVQLSGAAPVPRSYLGLSTEYWALSEFEQRPAVFDRVLSMLRPRGEGPLVLRIGGDSADRTFWDPHSLPLPSWAIALTPAWLQRLSELVQRTHVRLIIDLNLVTGSPADAAAWAEAALDSLPHGSVVGFEIGNEPDIYSRKDWLARTTSTGLGIKRPPSDLDVAPLPPTLASDAYDADFRAYADALAPVAPGVPLLGPALANPVLNARWISSLIAWGGLGEVSAHRYAFSGCSKPKSHRHPTIARLLSARATSGVADGLKGAVRLARRAGLRLRLTELNSVDCGGVPGVSNTFATALWAPDALFSLLRAGVDGVNLHVRPNAPNAAFSMNGRGLDARPLLYGLLLFARMLGPDAQLLAVRVNSRSSSALSAWAVHVRGGGIRVLLINKSSRPLTVTLRLPASAPARIERLLAPSVRSTSGVTLGGQWLGPGGKWLGRPAVETIPSRAGRYELELPRDSAAMLGVRSDGWWRSGPLDG